MAYCDCRQAGSVAVLGRLSVRLETKVSPMNVEAGLTGSVAAGHAPYQYSCGTGPGTAKPARVLVVDDDPAPQHMLASYFEQHNMEFFRPPRNSTQLGSLSRESRTS
jgi:hypothetical protein